MAERTISHHLLRRTARWKEKRIEKLQDRVLKPDHGAADEAQLRRYGVAPHDIIEVVGAKHGPYRYRVVAK